MGAERSYQLYISLSQPAIIPVGALGMCRFPSGRYIYTGSARRNIDARIRRHLGARKRMHWHVDYLLAAPGAAVERVTRSSLDECALNRRAGGAIVVPHFGASDCASGCGSHLKYVGA